MDIFDVPSGECSREDNLRRCINPRSLWPQLGRPLSLDADIPDHQAFPLYAPSFTLNVPAGTLQDRNTDEYLTHVEGIFDQVVEAIRNRMQTPARPER